MKTMSAGQTERLGAQMAAQFRAGDVVLLSGELGAGKTVFTRGVARGFGVQGHVVSPTFVLLRCYPGPIPLHHFDLYRLSDADAFYGAGLADFMGEEAVCLVEWPERCLDAMPACRLQVRIEYGPAEDERIITVCREGGFREVLL